MTMKQMEIPLRGLGIHYYLRLHFTVAPNGAR
jgi:hypothetical protein